MTGRPRPRVGILGGTFDPVHLGHVGIAVAARDELALDEVVFVPAGVPYLRACQPVATPEARAQMVAIAIHGESTFRLSRADIDRPGPSYSVDTVAAVQREFGHRVDLFFIVGADSLVQIAEWRDPERLSVEARIVCVGRPGENEVAALPEGHPGADAVFVQGPMVGVSGTEIRTRIRAGESVAEMVPPGVAEFIERHRLYREDNAAKGGEQLERRRPD